MVAGVFGAMMAAPVMALITRFNTDVRLPADGCRRRARRRGPARRHRGQSGMLPCRPRTAGELEIARATALRVS